MASKLDCWPRIVSVEHVVRDPLRISTIRHHDVHIVVFEIVSHYDGMALAISLYGIYVPLVISLDDPIENVSRTDDYSIRSDLDAVGFSRFSEVIVRDRHSGTVSTTQDLKPSFVAILARVYRVKGIPIDQNVRISRAPDVYHCLASKNTVCHGYISTASMLARIYFQTGNGKVPKCQGLGIPDIEIHGSLFSGC